MNWKKISDVDVPVGVNVIVGGRDADGEWIVNVFHKGWSGAVSPTWTHWDFPPAPPADPTVTNLRDEAVAAGKESGEMHSPMFRAMEVQASPTLKEAVRSAVEAIDEVKSGS